MDKLAASLPGVIRVEVEDQHEKVKSEHMDVVEDSGNNDALTLASEKFE